MAKSDGINDMSFKEKTKILSKSPETKGHGSAKIVSLMEKVQKGVEATREYEHQATQAEQRAIEAKKTTDDLKKKIDETANRFLSADSLFKQNFKEHNYRECYNTIDEILDFARKLGNTDAIEYYQKMKEPVKVELEILNHFTELIGGSVRKMSRDAIGTILGISGKILLDHLLVWTKKFNLIIDEPYVIFPIKASIDLSKPKLLISKDIVIFISYAHSDSDFFHVPEIAQILRTMPGIKSVYYSQHDVTENFVKFMDESLSQCDLLLLFCSATSMKSEWVKEEYRAAFSRHIPIVPVFTDTRDIPAILGARNGVSFDTMDVSKTTNDIYEVIQKIMQFDQFPKEKKEGAPTSQMEQLKNLVQVARVLKISQMAALLSMDERDLNKHLIEWAKKFGFVLDKEGIDFTNAKTQDFITELERSFDQWKKPNLKKP